jgi:NADH-quinone oxidoreductase subunit L
MTPESIQSLVFWLIPLSPLAAAVVTAALAIRVSSSGSPRQRSHLPCWFGLAVSVVSSFVLLWSIVPQGFADHGGSAVIASGYQWLNVGGMDVRVDIRADAMTAIMLAMVTSVSLLVAVFAAGYMHGDPGYARFFAEVSLFVFSRSCYQRPSAAAAAKKAFVVNRIGDFGFLLGIFLIWTTFGSLDFADVLNTEKITQLAADQPGTITLICLLLFLGAVGKSAQFPLHVWLPDAMEGPTPVSALIHAATMVTAGVYVIARCTPLFLHAPSAHLVVSGIGAVTALIAALVAMTQFDLKRVLAYSTVSQLGYMFMALGAGAAGASLATMAVTAAMFHLFSHAFFKALLFLAAGSVMHAMGDVIDMRRFGGLRRTLPITHWTFLCGAAALAGEPLLSGFWSKDEILVALHAASAHARYGAYFHAIYWIALLTALLTAIYSFRAYVLTFWGETRLPAEASHHPHDAPPVMAWPLGILALCAVVIGLVVGPTHWFADYMHHTSGLPAAEHHELHVSILVLSGVIALAGFALAWWMYVVSPQLPGRVAAALGPLYRAALNQFYFDEIYSAVVVTPLRTLAWLSDWFDRWVIDPLVDIVGMVPRLFSSVPRVFHNGLVPSYALVMWIGALVCMLFALRLLP